MLLVELTLLFILLISSGILDLNQRINIHYRRLNLLKGVELLLDLFISNLLGIFLQKPQNVLIILEGLLVLHYLLFVCCEMKFEKYGIEKLENNCFVFKIF